MMPARLPRLTEPQLAALAKVACGSEAGGGISLLVGPAGVGKSTVIDALIEDRPAIFLPVGKGLVAASEAEADLNPRARSAKLRAGIRTEAAAGKDDLSIFDLPSLTSLEKLGG